MTLLTASPEIAAEARQPRPARLLSPFRPNLWIGLSAFFLLATLVDHLCQNPLPINIDSGMYLDCGEKLLDGKIPYVDFIDLNPPLIMYLSAIPCAIARALHVHPIAAFIVSVWACAAASWAACFKLLRKSAVGENWTLTGPILVAIALLTFVMRCEYGQREHLFVLSYLPFFFFRWSRWQAPSEPRSQVLGAFLGLFAGVGLCLKPVFFIPAVAIELYWLFAKPQRMSTLFTTETVVAALVSIAYAAHFFFCPKAMQDSFFNIVVPLVMGGYSAYDCTLGEAISVTLAPFFGGAFFGVSWFLPALMVALCTAAVLLRQRSTLLIPLAIWSVAGYAVVVLQMKCFSYHTVPMVAGMFLLGAVVFAVCADFNKRFQQSVVDGVMMLAILLLFGWKNSPDTFNRLRFTTQLIPAIAAGDKAVFLTAVPWPTYPFLNQRLATNGSRYLWLCYFPMIENCKKHCSESNRAKWDALEVRILNELDEDIQKNQPRLIIISAERIDRINTKFVPYQYLQEHGFIERSMKNYRLWTCIQSHRIYLHE